MIIWSSPIKIISDHNNPQLLSQHQPYLIGQVNSRLDECVANLLIVGMPRKEGMKSNCRRPSSRYYAQSCRWAGRTVGHCSFGEHCNGPGDQNHFHVHRGPVVEVFHTTLLLPVMNSLEFCILLICKQCKNTTIIWTRLQKRVNCIILLIKCFGDPCKPWKSHKNEEAVQHPCVLNPGRIQNRQQWGVGSI